MNQKTENVSDKYFVEIVERTGNLVVKRMGPMGSRKADKVERGFNININDAYRTRIVSR